ncbi:MAG: hypothetical protein JRJ12_16645 [Deltaproteobacteria bacterium]|nr:hypothetical protein [Deltaproteobacteria bacterium]MBW2071610.1 hypothetical protein [Deltaproteobacteria bacterium]
MQIHMESYQPYRQMATTCKTRPVREGRITWTKIESEPFWNDRFQVKTLRRDLVEAAAELWRLAYPELYGSPHQFMLDPDQYEGLVALEENWEEDARNRVYCMPVTVELDTAKVVSATVLTKFEKNLQVEFSFAGTHPDYRLRGITNELRRVTRETAVQSGAEYFTTFCETWHDITQNWCIKGGWKIAGIFPGNFKRWSGDNREYRGCVVHFYRFVGEGEEYVTRPEEWHLAPEVKEVWEVLERVNWRIEERFKAAHS